jgi:hypothetical protein
MNVTVASIISAVSTLLQDDSNIRWPAIELLAWLNDGQREIVLAKPNACVRNTEMPLVLGTKQQIPNDGINLIEITRNKGGNAIRITSREILDAQIPNWHSQANAAATVKHYTYNPNDPKTFYVFPASPGGNIIEVVYSANPADCALNGTINLDDIYKSALINYIAFRAYSKDTEYAENMQLATDYYNKFASVIGIKTAVDTATNPNAAAKGNRNIV